jgi:hypothetical protein
LGSTIWPRSSTLTTASTRQQGLPDTEQPRRPAGFLDAIRTLQIQNNQNHQKYPTTDWPPVKSGRASQEPRREFTTKAQSHKGRKKEATTRRPLSAGRYPPIAKRQSEIESSLQSSSESSSESSPESSFKSSFESSLQSSFQSSAKSSLQSSSQSSVQTSRKSSAKSSFKRSVQTSSQSSVKSSVQTIT